MLCSRRLLPLYVVVTFLTQAVSTPIFVGCNTTVVSDSVRYCAFLATTGTNTMTVKYTTTVDVLVVGGGGGGGCSLGSGGKLLPYNHK